MDAAGTRRIHVTRTAPSTSRARRGIAAVAALLAGGGALAAIAAAPASANPSAGVVLNEVYGGGGNSGALLKNDFVELTNRGAGSQSVATWSLQYLPAAATSSWQITGLVGAIAAGDNYLVGEAAGTGPGDPLPPTQVDGSVNLSGTAGTVALVRTTAALTCKTAADCGADPDVVDLIGYGPSAVVREGTPAPAPSNTVSDNRKGTPDTDDNSADFVTAAPTPTGSSATPPPEPGPLRIHDIQGSSWVSPHAGDSVTNVPGIVTALRTSGSKGYWIQDPLPDADAATSEGIFVFTSSAPTASVGDSVLVSGKVSDYYPLASGDTVSGTSNLSVTEIGSASTAVLSHDNALPGPIVLTPTTVPNLYAPDLGGANIENTPITPTRSALDYYESIEGMRVEVDNARVVGPSDQYGEQYVTTKPNQNRTYRGGTELQAENATPSGRLEVVPADGSNPGVDVGDVFGGPTAGPIDYSQYGGYVLVATTLGSVDKGNLAPVVATPAKKKQLSVATYNVENLAPADSATKYQRLAQGVVTNLASPDIVAVEEVQDNTGATDGDGVVAADATLTKLTNAITTAGGPAYQWREIDPVADQDGGAPGGNIRVVFLFDPARVSFVDSGLSSVNRTTTATTAVKARGQLALSLSPGRIDPTNPVWSTSRKPLVGEFRFGGKPVFVVANHFDSKLGDQNADGRYQYPTRSSEVQRAGQAAAVHDFVSSLLAIDKKADVLVVGDLNDYQFSPALKVLTTGTAAGTGTKVLTDLITTLPADQQYTYVYDGISQVLDHILVSPKVGGVHYQVVHVNAEYSDQVSDHDPQVVDVTP
jgi:predicted extracellular nuclease